MSNELIRTEGTEVLQKYTADLDLLPCHWGLLILIPTGVYWTRQVGGHSCSHLTAEGTWIPYRPAAYLELTALLYDIHPGDQLDIDGPHYDVALANEVQRLLDADAEYMRLVVQPHQESCEAWLRVLIERASPGLEDVMDQIRGHAFRSFEGCEAILTWPNSD